MADSSPYPDPETSDALDNSSPEESPSSWPSPFQPPSSTAPGSSVIQSNAANLSYSFRLDDATNDSSNIAPSGSPPSQPSNVPSSSRRTRIFGAAIARNGLDYYTSFGAGNPGADAGGPPSPRPAQAGTAAESGTNSTGATEANFGFSNYSPPSWTLDRRPGVGDDSGNGNIPALSGAEQSRTLIWPHPAMRDLPDAPQAFGAPWTWDWQPHPADGSGPQTMEWRPSRDGWDLPKTTPSQGSPPPATGWKDDQVIASDPDLNAPNTPNAAATLGRSPLLEAQRRLTTAQQTAADTSQRVAAMLQGLGVRLYDPNTARPLDVTTIDPEAIRSQVSDFYDAALNAATDAARRSSGEDLDDDSPQAATLRAALTHQRAQAMQGIDALSWARQRAQSASDQYDQLQAPVRAQNIRDLRILNDRRAQAGLPPVPVPAEWSRLAALLDPHSVQGDESSPKISEPRASDSAPSASWHVPSNDGGEATSNHSPESTDNSTYASATNPSMADQFQAVDDARAGRKIYSYDDEAGIQFPPDKVADGLRQAVQDGLVDPQWAAAHLDEFQTAQDKYQQLEKAAGGAQQLKALLHGGGIGVAGLGGSIGGAKLGGLAGAAIPGLGETGLSEGAGAIIGGLIGGGMSMYAAKGLLDTLGKYFSFIQSLNASAKLHPNYDAAGQFIGMSLNAPSALGNLYNVARLAGEAGTTVNGLRLALGIAGRGAATAALFESTVRPAFDLAKNAVLDQLGLPHTDFQSPTLKSIITSAALGLLTAGHNIQFKDYSAPQIGNIFTRVQVRYLAGLPLDAELTPQQVAAAAKRIGLGDIDPTNLTAPLNPQEMAVFNTLARQAVQMKASGQYEGRTVTGVTARQASIPRAGGKPGVPIATHGTFESEAPAPAESPTALLAPEDSASPPPSANRVGPLPELPSSGGRWGALAPELTGRTVETRDGRTGRLIEVGQQKASFIDDQGKIQVEPLGNIRFRPAGTTPGPANPPLIATGSRAPLLSGQSPEQGWGQIAPGHIGQQVETRDGHTGTLVDVGQQKIALVDQTGQAHAVRIADTRLAQPLPTGGPPQKTKPEETSSEMNAVPIPIGNSAISGITSQPGVPDTEGPPTQNEGTTENPDPPKPTEPYKRRFHYGYTPTIADRHALGVQADEVVDHDPALAIRYYDGDPALGEKPGYQMTPDERRASATDIKRIKRQPRSESNAQGGEVSNYSKRKKKHYGLH